MQFLVNDVAYDAPVPLSGGDGQLMIAEPVGSYTVTAEYTGDANYAATLPADETPAMPHRQPAAPRVSIAREPGRPRHAKGSRSNSAATGTYTDGSTADLTSQVTLASSGTTSVADASPTTPAAGTRPPPWPRARPPSPPP